VIEFYADAYQALETNAPNLVGKVLPPARDIGSSRSVRGSESIAVDFLSSV